MYRASNLRDASREAASGGLPWFLALDSGVSAMLSMSAMVLRPPCAVAMSRQRGVS